MPRSDLPGRSLSSFESPCITACCCRIQAGTLTVREETDCAGREGADHSNGPTRPGCLGSSSLDQVSCFQPRFACRLQPFSPSRFSITLLQSWGHDVLFWLGCLLSDYACMCLFCSNVCILLFCQVEIVRAGAVAKLTTLSKSSCAIEADAANMALKTLNAVSSTRDAISKMGGSVDVPAKTEL